MSTNQKDDGQDTKCATKLRDALLLRLLKTPPHPRPKRERDKNVQPKRKKPKKKTPGK